MIGRSDLAEEFFKLHLKLDKILKCLGGMKYESSFKALINDVPGDKEDQGFKFPIKSVEEMNQFEENLREDNFFKNMFQKFRKEYQNSKLEGKAIAYTLIEQLTDRQVLTNYTWTGASRFSTNKLRFADLEYFNKLFLSIVRSVDSNFKLLDHEDFFKNRVLKYSEIRARDRGTVRRRSAPKAGGPKTKTLLKMLQSGNLNIQEIVPNKDILPQDSINSLVMTLIVPRKELPNNNVNNKSTPVNSKNKCASCGVSSDAIEKLIIGQQKIMKRLDYLTDVIQTISFLGQEFKVEMNDFTLPINTFDELIDLNAQLHDPDLFRKMVKYLKQQGGKNVAETTRRIMSKIVDHSLSLNMNWTGRFNKPAFKDNTQIVAAIRESVRLNPPCAKSTDKEIEDLIKIWLRGSVDREGGRNERKNRARLEQEPDSD